MSFSLWQMGVSQAVDNGCRGACVRVDEALDHGDVGFGLRAGSGELAVFRNGVCYELSDSSEVTMARSNERLCQCLIGPFDHYAPVFLSGDLNDLASLRALLDSRREVARARNHPQLMMATGTLRYAVLSGARMSQDSGWDGGASAPQKAVMELEDVSGSIIGRRIPGFLAPHEPTGWRFVFLSEDRTRMGRLLGASGLSLACQITSFEGIDLHLPASREFNELALR